MALRDGTAELMPLTTIDSPQAGELSLDFIFNRLRRQKRYLDPIPTNRFTVGMNLLLRSYDYRKRLPFVDSVHAFLDACKIDKTELEASIELPASAVDSLAFLGKIGLGKVDIGTLREPQVVTLDEVHHDNLRSTLLETLELSPGCGTLIFDEIDDWR